MGTPSIPALQAVDVHAGYGRTAVLHGLDLSVARGEICALLGANGAGKTSTLNLFLGFAAPKRGQVRVLGLDPLAEPASVRRQLAYIPETVAVYEHLSARENLGYLLRLAGLRTGPGPIDDALAQAGLPAAAFDRRVAGFSKGMRQKVAIALALARRVPVLLLDEPTSGLDPQATADFNGLLRQLRADGVAILMVTHDLLSAAEVADRIGVLDQGRLRQQVAAADGAERFDVRALQRCFGTPREAA